MARRVPPSCRARTESGAGALELAFLAPGLIFLIFLTIQAGLFFYGKTVYYGYGAAPFVAF